PFTLTAAPEGAAAVCSLWHCPADRSGWALPTTVPDGARTFLGPGASAPRTRLPGRLVHAQSTTALPRPSRSGPTAPGDVRNVSPAASEAPCRAAPEWGDAHPAAAVGEEDPPLGGRRRRPGSGGDEPPPARRGPGDDAARSPAHRRRDRCRRAARRARLRAGAGGADAPSRAGARRRAARRLLRRALRPAGGRPGPCRGAGRADPERAVRTRRCVPRPDPRLPSLRRLGPVAAGQGRLLVGAAAAPHGPGAARRAGRERLPADHRLPLGRLPLDDGDAQRRRGAGARGRPRPGARRG